jgi:SnoaL-like domain
VERKEFQVHAKENEMSSIEVDGIARKYIETVGNKEVNALESLFADSLVATVGGNSFSKAEWIQALERLFPALVRNEIRKVFVDGADACVVYDFVTDTEAGAVPCVEVLTVRNAQITSIELIFERLNWSSVLDAIRERTVRA